VLFRSQASYASEQINRRAAEKSQSLYNKYLDIAYKNALFSEPTSIEKSELTYDYTVLDMLLSTGESKMPTDVIEETITEKIKTEIQKIKNSKTADIIMVSLHWGDEYQNQSNLSQQNTARFLIENGADLIIGHHPHVAQEIEHYRNGWAVYSLGNFVFDQYFSKETMEGLMLRVVVKSKKILNIAPEEVRINNAFQPEIKSL